MSPIITYLSNSGYALEYNSKLLVFDCYNPQSQTLSGWLSANVDEDTTVFISHAHPDHYSSDIFLLPAEDYAVSFDIKAPKRADKHIVTFNPNESEYVNGIEVKAFGSTDEGVSFYVNIDGLSVFHAGDLNYWHWFDEGGEEYAKCALAAFDEVMGKIRGDINSLDIAFFPVDPRMGSDYYRGAVMFAEQMKPKYLMPMHFGREYNKNQSFVDEVKKHTVLLDPPSRGQSIEIEI